jgi:tetratricopeptide (TPR) repeat protein
MIINAIRSWLERREAMQELASVQRVEKERDVMRFKVLLERIEAAMSADQHGAALRLWHEIQERLYTHAVRSEALFKILLNLRAFDDAEKLMNVGLEIYPREQFYIVGRARVAELSGDIPSALERWAEVRKKFPHLALGYAQTAACLIKAGQMEEAEAMLARGIKRSPDDVFCLMEHARMAEARGALDQALVRWQHLREVHEDDRHPCYQNGTIGLAQCLRKMGRVDEAEALLQPFVERFGVQEGPLFELARIAEDRGNWAEAIKRWQRVKNSFPMNMTGYLGQIEIFKMSGLKADAERVLGEMVDRLPEELLPATSYAAMAQEANDNAEAVRRWLGVIDRFPDYEPAYHHRAVALAALGQEDAAAALRAEHSKRFPT